MGATSAEPVAHSPCLDAVQSLLIPGERLEFSAIQHRLFALTHRRYVVGATSGRLIAVQRGLISGFTTQDVRWQDLRDAQLQVGIFGATLTVTADPGEDLAGAHGKRFALPHSRVLLHQPHGGAQGQAVDIEIQAKEITRYRKLLEQLISEHTGQPLDKVAKDTDRDYILTAEEAKDYGVVDEIITTRGISVELAAAAAGGA